MATLPTSAQVTSGTTTNAQQKTYFASLFDFLLDLLGSDSSNKAAARATLGVPVGANLIVNGNFNINQRVYVSAAATSVANQVTLDRWRVVTSGQNLSFTASGDGRIVTAPAGGIEQIVFGTDIGSAAHVINWVGTATCTVDGVAKLKGDAVTLVPGTNASIKFFGGTVSRAQLEPGAGVTQFQDRDLSIELALCRADYEKSYDLTVAPNTVTTVGATSGPRATYSGSDRRDVLFMTPKRSTPTMVYYSPATGASGNWRDSGGVDTAATTVTAGQTKVVVEFTSATVGTYITGHWTAATGF